MNHRHFQIKSEKDLLSMRKDIRDLKDERTYIANEFAQNLLDAKEVGEIVINGRSVQSIVETKDTQKIEDRINLAKEMIKKNQKIGKRGYAFFTILLSGWDLKVKKENSKTLILAEKY